MKHNILFLIILFALSTCNHQQSEQETFYTKQVRFENNETLASKFKKAARVVPTKKQYAWQQLEMTAFIHFGINTFTNREWGDGKESPTLFNPSELNTEQWVKTLKETGFKMIIITAKHHDGFCLWQTETTTHSVKSSPWEKGKGDVVKSLKEACDKYDMKFGVYLSPWDRNADCYGDSPAYNDFFVAQLTELLTWYGKVDEVWFDGANGEDPNGKKQVYNWDRYYKMIKELQPDAVTAIMGNDVRWVGTESGYGRETEWSVTALPPGGSKTTRNINKSLKLNATSKDLGSREVIKKAEQLFWYPAEVDVSIRPGWFYHENQDNKVKSLPKLIDIYFSSVGRNTVLLLNIPPNKKGLIADNDIERLYQFKDYLDKTFKENRVATYKKTPWSANTNNNAELVINLDKEVTFNVLELQEDILQGQRVEEFTIYANIDEEWAKIAQSTTIGHKKLLRVPQVTTDKIKLVINKSRALAKISNFSVYKAPEMLSTPTIYRDKGGVVTITTESKLSNIRYTLDGSEPTASSLAYKNPFVLKNGGIIKAKAFINNFGKSSSTVTKRFFGSKGNWKIVAASSELHNHSARNAIDDDEKTMWHTPWSGKIPKHPHFIEVDMGGQKQFDGFYYIPRRDENKSGTVEVYSFLISNDGKNWQKIVNRGEMSNIANNPIEQYINFEQPVHARYFKFISHSGVYSEDWLSAAEIGVMD